MMRGPRCGEVASHVGRQHISNITTPVTLHLFTRQMYLRPSSDGTSAVRALWKMARGRSAGQHSRTAFVQPWKDRMHIT